MRWSSPHSERARRAALALAGALGLVLTAGAAPARTVARGGARALVRASLEAEAFDPLALRVGLDELGAPVVPELFELVLRDALVIGDEVRPLDVGHRLVLRATLCARREELRSFLTTRVAADAAEGERILGLELLRRCGTTSDVMLLLRLAPRSAERPTVEPRVADALIAALRGIEGRQPNAHELVARLFHTVPRGTLPAVIRYLAERRPDERVHRLVELLGAVPDADDLVLFELVRALRGRAPRLDERSLARIRSYLDADEPALVALASELAGRLRDTDAFGTLVALLDEDGPGEPNTRAKVEAALESIAGCRPGTDHATWLRWLESEEAWWSAEAPGAEAAVFAQDAEASARAIRELARHRLYADAATDALLPGLRREETALVRLTIAALDELRSDRALRGLLACLRRPEPELRALAADALREQTGASLPTDHRTWEAYLERRTPFPTPESERR